jgi:hypothetical protein
MNESWNTVNMNALLPRGKSKDEVSMSDINALLKNRSYNQEPSEYNADDMHELQEYCQKHGILGVNFGNRNPKAVLQMLKARMGERSEPTIKRGILHG